MGAATRTNATRQTSGVNEARASRHSGGIKLATHEPEEPLQKQFEQLRYDYEQIDAAHRQQVREAAVHIRIDAEQAQRSIILVGQRLIEVKALLPHGQFTEWIATEFDWSERSAQGFMTVAREYGGDEKRIETASMFSTGALLVLAAPSTPDDVRAAMEAQAEATGIAPTRAEIRDALREARGEVEVAPSPHATVAELQMVISEWVKREFYYLDKEIEALRLMVEKGPKHRIGDLMTQLVPQNGVASYRDSDLQLALEAVLAQRVRKKATMEAAPKPPPPPPPAPSAWEIANAIRKWLDTKVLPPKEQHKLLSELKEKEKNPKSPFRDVEHQQMIAALPERWGKRALKGAVNDVLESLAQKFGEEAWEAHQLPSGKWYAVNKGRLPHATTLFASASEALLHVDEADSINRQFYKEVESILTNPAQWVGDRTFEAGPAWQLWEIYTALEARVYQPDPPPFIRKRLDKVAKRIEDARRLVGMFTPSGDGVVVAIDRRIAEKLLGAAAALSLGALTLVEQAALEDVLARALAQTEPVSDGKDD